VHGHRRRQISLLGVQPNERESYRNLVRIPRVHRRPASRRAQCGYSLAAAMPPDVRKLFDLPWTRPFLILATPQPPQLGFLSELEALGIAQGAFTPQSEGQRPSAHQAAEPHISRREPPKPAKMSLDPRSLRGPSVLWYYARWLVGTPEEQMPVSADVHHQVNITHQISNTFLSA
jgi:hypothetical protein